MPIEKELKAFSSYKLEYKFENEASKKICGWGFEAKEKAGKRFTLTDQP